MMHKKGTEQKATVIKTKRRQSLVVSDRGSCHGHGCWLPQIPMDNMEGRYSAEAHTQLVLSAANASKYTTRTQAKQSSACVIATHTRKAIACCLSSMPIILTDGVWSIVQ